MQKYVIKMHARDRYREYGGASFLEAELNDSMPFGVCTRDCWYRLLPCNLVAVGRMLESDLGWERVIVTVLRFEHAVSKCQMADTRRDRRLCRWRKKRDEYEPDTEKSGRTRNHKKGKN